MGWRIPLTTPRWASDPRGEGQGVGGQVCGCVGWMGVGWELEAIFPEPSGTFFCAQGIIHPRGPKARAGVDR